MESDGLVLGPTLLAAVAGCSVATDRGCLCIFVAAEKKPELDGKVKSNTVPEGWVRSVRRTELSISYPAIGELNGEWRRTVVTEVCQPDGKRGMQTSCRSLATTGGTNIDTATGSQLLRQRGLHDG
jgi:hypothetical protein